MFFRFSFLFIADGNTKESKKQNSRIYSLSSAELMIRKLVQKKRDRTVLHARPKVLSRLFFTQSKQREPFYRFRRSTYFSRVN